MKARIYFLISTTNSANGWSVYGSGTKKEMEQLSLTHESFQDKSALNSDIYAQTLNKNSKVVSKTIAKRIFRLNIEN